MQKLADRISAVFVPSVLAIALITGAGWYAFGVATAMDSGVMWSKLANAVFSVRISACPCALGLAWPAALSGGGGVGCTRCGKPRGTDKRRGHMVARLANHWMFTAPGALDRLRMCADCRVVDLYNTEKGVDGREL